MNSKSSRFTRIQKKFYPDILIDHVDGDPAFVKEVVAAVRKTQIGSLKRSNPGVERTLRRLKKRGLIIGFDYFCSQVARRRRPISRQTLDEDFACFVEILEVVLGQLFYEAIPIEQRKLLFPLNAFEIGLNPDATFIRVRCHSLRLMNTPFGEVWFPRSRPAIRLADQDLVVAYGLHTIERMQKRMLGNDDSYPALSALYHYFDGDLHLQACELHGGQPAIAAYGPVCVYGHHCETDAYHYVIEVAGSLFSTDEQYYLLGYLPLRVYHGFAITSTALLPGFRGTPEYGLIIKKTAFYDEKRRMLDAVNRWEKLDASPRLDAWLLRWFHRHGAAQVIKVRKEDGEIEVPTAK